MRRPTPFVLPPVPTCGRDLVALGVTERMLRRAADSGRLLRLRRDVYLDPLAWPSDEESRHLLRAQAELVVHHGAAVSHWSAASMWGLPQPLACNPVMRCG